MNRKWKTFPRVPAGPVVMISLAIVSRLSIVSFANGVKTNGDSPSTVRKTIDFKLGNHALPMPEVIASLRINLSGGSMR